MRKHRVRHARLVSLAAAILIPGAGHGEVVLLPASRDNTLFEEVVDASNGAGDHVFAGTTKDGFVRRAPIAFDVAGSIPAGSTINAVTLRLYLSRTRTQNQDVSLHRIAADWGEGASHAAGEEGTGTAAKDGDATWLYRFYDEADPPSSIAWTDAGGDFDSLASATTVVGNQTGIYTWTSPAMAADVQDWLDGVAPNHGWMVLGNEVDTRVVKRFDSRTNPTAAQRPELEVDFTAPAATGACCAVDGSCSVFLDPGGGCTGNYQGAGSVCSPNPCPQPAGACCFADAAATCQVETQTDCASLGGNFQGDFTSCSPTTCPAIPTPFLDPLPRPAAAQPVSGAPSGAASYDMTMREIQQQLHSQLPPSTVWGYGDGPTGASYPGPTIEARVGEPITVNWINDLRDTAGGGALRTSHYLPVDLCPHGALENADARTVVHLHGAHVASEFDGHPDATFPPGSQVTYEYPNWQLPATLWYHDHALGITRLNVQMGMAGFWLLRDAYEESLGLPAGEFEIPIAIQDRSVNADGTLRYPATWQEMFFGETIVVNGRIWPYLEVKQGKYRFRLLDGSSSRSYRLSLSDDASFHVIGMEGGLLEAPVPVNEVTLGPGERADVVMDFARYTAGTEILLVNDAPAPFPGTAGVGVVADVMKFVVTAEGGHTDPLPAALRPKETLQEADATEFREFHLEKNPGVDQCSPFQWQIRSVVGGTVVGQQWDDLTELPELGQTEVWKFVNKSGVTHPMHMHLVMFQVLDRQAFEIIGGAIMPIGSPVPPAPHEAGWKDTVRVGPNEIVRVIARFENYLGLFPYHCHILEHEDHEMMRQFQTVAIVPACANGVDDDGDGLQDFAGGDPGCLSETDPSEREPALGCDDGIDNDGDGGTDFPDDLGCYDPTWIEDPACDDGIDNDGDGVIDWDGAGLGDPDPDCEGRRSRNRETPPRRCGAGLELAVVLPPLLWLRRRRRRR